jgi:hypothetical protein
MKPPITETIYVPIRVDEAGQEFVHLEGASFLRAEAEAAARGKSGEWARRNRLVRIGEFTLTEVRAGEVRLAAPVPPVPVRRPRRDGASEWARGLDEEGHR